VDDHAAQRFAERVLGQGYQPEWREAITAYLQALCLRSPLTNTHPQSPHMWEGNLGELTVIWDARRNALVTILPTVRTERHAMTLPFVAPANGWIGDRAHETVWRSLMHGGRLMALAPDGWAGWYVPERQEMIWLHHGLRIMHSVPIVDGETWAEGSVDYEGHDDRVRAILRTAARDLKGAWGAAMGSEHWVGRTPQGFVVCINRPLNWLVAAWRPEAPRWRLDTGDDLPNWDELWHDVGQPVNSGIWQRTLERAGYTWEEFTTTYWGGWMRLAGQQWAEDHALPPQYWWHHLNEWVWYLGRPITETEFREWATPTVCEIHQWSARTWRETLAALPRRFPHPQHPCRPNSGPQRQVS
jgi:hypothetical protein